MTNEEEQTALTMWSESLLEGLYVGIAKSGNNNALRELLKELKQKGYEEKYLINKVTANVSPAAGKRLEGLLGQGGASPATASNNKKKKKGIFSRFFGK